MASRIVANSALLKISGMYLGLIEAITEREQGKEEESNERVRSINQAFQKRSLSYHEIESICREYSIDPQNWINELKRLVESSLSGNFLYLREEKDYILATTLYIRKLLSSKEIFKRAI